MRQQAPGVRVRDLHKSYRPRAGALGARRVVHALAGVSLDIPAGTTLGLVGESGCGKSTLGRCLVGLEPPSAGHIQVGDWEVGSLRGAALRHYRREAQYIFQDPYASLDPRMRVGPQIAEPLAIHELVPRAARRAAVEDLLRRVGLSEEAWERFPHEFSGGQRQRVVIARALAVGPGFLVADEPVSALDVSVQAQVLNLILDIKAELGLTLLFVAHDLSVVEFVSDRVAVLYLGRVVECGPRATVFGAPRHPYTLALLASAPRSDPTQRQQPPALPGDPPSPSRRPPGCPFHPRCTRASAQCTTEAPPARLLGEDHEVSCWHA